MRAEPWILNDLPELLVEDWYNNHIFTEYDLQVATYHHLRVAYGCDTSWRFRSQPNLGLKSGVVAKPDITILKGTILQDAIELKCMLDGFNWSRLAPDLRKFKELGGELRHAYVIVLYDDDRVENLGVKDDWMKNYLTFVGANVRRHQSRRLRNGYDAARRRWQTYYREL